jgi:hypothetical protein
MIDT